MTEADKALERAEKSRRRKHQSEKKLEDEVRSCPSPDRDEQVLTWRRSLDAQKTETINRLLKKQAGKSAGRSSKASHSGTKFSTPIPSATPTTTTMNGVLVGPGAVGGAPKELTMLRYVSSVKNGTFAVGISVPPALVGKVTVLSAAAAANAKAGEGPKYPDPRLSPKTRRLR